MDWNAPTWWWLIAGLLVAVELATTTFYLLMMALGAVAGALAAHLGLRLDAQVSVAAAVGGGAVVALYALRRRRGRSLPAAQAADAALQLDIGARVQVPAWQADGDTRLAYRGSTWSARYVGSGAAVPGPHVIRGVQGSLLLLDRLPD